MKIALIAAMEGEVQILRDKIIDCHIENYFGIDFHLGQLATHSIILMKSGIGKVASASATTLLLNQYSVDLVINTGSAGGLITSLNIGDIVISTDVTYHDADVTPFGYKLGQMPGCPITFPACKKYGQLAYNVAVLHKLNAIEGLICSGDTFINGSKQLQFIQDNFPNAIAVDMEAAAIGHVCWLMGLPFVVIRAVSDVADKNSAISFEEFLPQAAKNSSLIVETVLEQLTSAIGV